MQTASAVIFWEYERQKGKDIARAAKEKAFQEGNDEDKRVSFPISCSVVGAPGLRAEAVELGRRSCSTSYPVTWASCNGHGWGRGACPALRISLETGQTKQPHHVRRFQHCKIWKQPTQCASAEKARWPALAQNLIS